MSSAKFNVQMFEGNLQKQNISVTDRDIVGSGGQGVVYKSKIQYGPNPSNVDMMALKVFDSTLPSIPPPAKIRLIHDKLKSFSRINVPKGYVTKGVEYAGYVSPFVMNSEPIVTIFPKIAKDRNKITPEILNSLVIQMRSIMDVCHSAGIVVVDFNEFNLLIDKSTYKQLCMIDLDGCQVDSYPALAVMDSIRDRQTNGYSKASDWFSFAVIAFQLYTGIHPYRGTDSAHTIKSQPALDQRMKTQLSVFDPSVRLPKAISDFRSAIPANYLAWFESVFVRGNRAYPPDTFQEVVLAASQMNIIQHAGDLKYKVRKAVDSNIIQCYSIKGVDIIHTEDGLYMGNRYFEDIAPYAKLAVNINSSGEFDGVRTAIVKDSKLHIRKIYIDNDVPEWETLPFPPVTTCVTTYPILSQSLPMTFAVLSNGNIMSVSVPRSITDIQHYRESFPVSPASTRIFDGCAVQLSLGSWYIMALATSVNGLFVRELDGFSIIAAERKAMVIYIVAEKDGNLYSFILRFTLNFNKYHVYKRNITTADINFVVKYDDHGADAKLLFMEEDSMFLMTADVNDNRIKEIDPGELAGARLALMDGNVVAFKDNVIYDISLS